MTRVCADSESTSGRVCVARAGVRADTPENSATATALVWANRGRRS
jgi:hypothetical protein